MLKVAALASKPLMISSQNNHFINSSIPSILRIAFPLILSAFSMNLLFVVDRIILAKYSLEAMNGAMFGGTLVSTFNFILICIAGTTEIFVGQCNGAKEYRQIATSVWQMIYMSLIAAAIFFPIGHYAHYLNMMPAAFQGEGIPYQRILTYFCWAPAITSALVGFFVGRGRSKIVTLIVVVGNISNI